MLENRKFIFDIPIYVCDSDHDWKLMQGKEQKMIDGLTEMGASSEIIEPQLYHHRKKSEGPWEFNRVFAWLKLWVSERTEFGSQVRAQLWKVDAKRISRRMHRKRFVQRWEDVIAICFKGNETSEQIYDEIVSEIRKLANDSEFKSHFIHLESFENIGPHINWKSLLGF